MKIKTNRLIIEQGRILFNEQGFKNITLREIAKKLNKSYGNITYHFATKEALIMAIFKTYHQELLKLQSVPTQYDNLLHYFLVLPAINFDIMVKYSFFFRDFVELKRTFPAFMQQVEAGNAQRIEQWKKLLFSLQQSGFLREDLTKEDFDYIIELSAAIRTFYFQNNLYHSLNKSIFSKKVNQLLLPYLSKDGHQAALAFLEAI